MFSRKTDYLKMEKIQYKALKIVFNSNESLEDPLLHSTEVSIYQKQLRQLTTEIYKSLTDLSPSLQSRFLQSKNYHITYIMGISYIYHRHELPAMVPIQYFSEHFKCGIIYRFP